MKPTRQKALTLCMIGGMFGVHLFYLNKPWEGLLMLLMTVFGMLDFIFNQSVFIICIPSVISLYTAYKLYTITDEQFNSFCK